jgi:molecular chaperone Hsp33
MTDPIEIEETYSDRLLGITLPARHVRGRVVRLDGLLDTILSAHDYPPAITNLLAEALVMATLLGGLLKEDGSQLTMQAQSPDGIVSLLVCDYRDGELRGYAEFDGDRLARLGSNPPLPALFGVDGHLAITFDLPAGGGRYQGIVPLEGASLAEACEHYFARSEQVPTLIRLGIRNGPDGCIAGGLLVQHLAEGEEGRERLYVRMDRPEWEHVAILAGSTRHQELVDRNLSLEALVWRLFHEEDEVHTQLGRSLTRGCRCSVEHFSKVLARFPEDERAAMRAEDGSINVDCAFCSRIFPINQ